MSGEKGKKKPSIQKKIQLYDKVSNKGIGFSYVSICIDIDIDTLTIFDDRVG